MVGWYHQLNGHESDQLWETEKAREACVLQSMRSERLSNKSERLNNNNNSHFGVGFALLDNADTEQQQ